MGRPELKTYEPDEHESPWSDEQRCTARARSGRRCGQPHIRGHWVCRKHGGSVPAVRKAAQRGIKREAMLGELVMQMDPRPVESPSRDLRTTAAHALALRDAAAVLVAGLPSVMAEGPAGAPVIHDAVKLYERALDRSTKVLVEMVRLDLEAKGVALEASQQGILLAALDAAFAAVGVTGEQKIQAYRVISEQLTSE